MKHYLLYSILAVLAFGVLASTSSATSVSFDDGTTWNCNQLFEPKTIRYAYYYDFWDNFTNKNQSIYTNYLNSYAVQFKNGDYLSQGQKCANGKPFCWTTELRDAGFAVAPKQTMKVLSTYSADWRVVRHPTSRTIGSNYDFMIAYKIDYDTSNNYPDASDDTSHVECQPYQVSWCGDGTVDSSYETCDAGIDNGMPGKCNVSCNGVNPPESNTCDKTFSPVVLRYWTTYKFFDEYTNNDSFSHFLRSFNAQFIEPFDFNNSPVVPSFDWTSSLNAVGNIVPAGASKVRIIEATNDYMIRSVPPVRNSDNLMIKYRVYVQNIAGGNLVSHLECQPYEISWCGDGVLDTNIQVGPGQYYTEPCDPAAEPWKSNGTCRISPTDGSKCELIPSGPICGDGVRNGSEACDPMDTSGDGWGNANPGCNASCNPVNVQNPVCGDGTRNGSESCDYNDPTKNGWGNANPGCNASCNPVYITPPVCIPGATTGPRSSLVTQTTPGLCPAGQTVGDFTPSVVGTTRNYVWSCNGSQVGGACSASYTPPVSIFDLSIKKYVNSAVPANDAQNASTAISLNQNDTFNYIIRVKNEGSAVTNETTTVKDTLPAGVTTNGTPIGTNWSCTTSAGTLTCTSTQVIAAGGYYPDITVPMRVNVANGTVTNYAVVHNPSETGPCYADGHMPAGNETICSRDPKNIDPAVIQVGTPTPTVPSCSTLTPSSGVTGVAPNTAITYTCSSAGFTGPVTNLEYNISCGASDATATWSGSSTRVCTAPNGYSASQAVACGIRDKTNPTVTFSGSSIGSCLVNVTTQGGSSGGASHVGKVCINDIATCATYNSHTACTSAGAVGCWSADAAGQATCQSYALSCSGPSGPPSTPGRCGDGVLQSGEECDVVGAPWCVSCKIDMTTTPGENAIDTWITIPTLSNVRFGGSPQVPFRENRVVVGVGTKVFTLADLVALGIKQDRTIPLMLEYNKVMCLESLGDALQPKKVCTTFGDAMTQLSTSNTRVVPWTRPIDGKKFVILGKGDIQFQNVAGGPYSKMTVDSASTITLFKGAKLYTIPGGGAVTLQDAFIGARVASADGRIALGTENAGSYYNFEHFSVRTSAAIVGTSGTPVNRSIESFVNQSGVAAFLRSLRSDSTTTSATTTANASSSIAPVTVNVSMLGSQRASTTSDLERFAVNGNKNVLAIKNGDLTVECAPGKSTFEMTGVRTVLVENGNIIFKCNTSYASNDTTSSWAWIVKGGDIKVYNGIGVLSDGAVTNISGIYVAIKDSTGGDITYTGNTTTQKILKIEGSLYGNASPLFRSRLYARGTSAYDILTTGTIISYSNRALVSPPPLLSQYLNNYSVQRVVR